MKGKIRRLCLTLLIPLLLLMGCGQGREQAKEPSAEELLKEVLSNQKQLKSGKMQMTMNFKAAMPLEEAQDLLGDVQDSAIQMDMDAELQFQEERMRMDGELNMQIMSMKIPVPIESYTGKSGDKYVTYTKNGEEWQKSETDVSGGDMGALVFAGQELYQGIQEESLTMTEETLELDNETSTECYVIHSSIGGEVLNSLFSMAGQVPGQENVLGDFRIEDEKVDLDLYVDKKEKEIIRTRIDMRQLMEKMMSDLTAQSGTDQTMKVDKFQIAVTIKERGETVEVEVPQEALDAEEL